MPHCSPDGNREVTPGQKAGALRIHGALHGPRRGRVGGGSGGRWGARRGHTASFPDTQKPGAMKNQLAKNNMLPFLLSNSKTRSPVQPNCTKMIERNLHCY